MSSWNHRVLIYPQHPIDIEIGNDEKHFRIHEVHYDVDGKPTTYSKEARPVCGEDLDSLKWTLEKMLDCLSKPVLWYGDRWPEEYKP